MQRSGFVLIADITGFTSYLSESEIEHAEGTLTDLLELLVETTPAPLVVSQLEGDAVMSYAFQEGFVTGQSFLEALEDVYLAFRRAIELKVLNNTCKCNACANVSRLDVKFFVHFGSFVIQPVGAVVGPVGPGRAGGSAWADRQPVSHRLSSLAITYPSRGPAAPLPREAAPLLRRTTVKTSCWVLNQLSVWLAANHGEGGYRLAGPR